MKRLAEIEKIIMETERKLRKFEEMGYESISRDVFKAMEISAFKVEAYNKIHKLLFGDKK